MSSLKPIRLWGGAGPNPPKVAMVLSLLEVPYTTIPIPFTEVKNPRFVQDINPNGRMPAIQDPNTDITLWESGAIIEYLIETYDKARKLSFEPGTKEAFQAKQWLYFQVSGQGPYYGQITWFKNFHPEKVPSAEERYTKELQRVTGVLNDWLSRQYKKHGEAGGGPWLVADKMSYADVSFVMWQRLMTVLPLLQGVYDEKNYPFVQDWMRRLIEVDGISQVFERAMASRNKPLGWEGLDKYLS